MSAAYPVEESSETARIREPSMEDILASIRRIIAEDQALFAADDAGRATVEAEEAAPESEIQSVFVQSVFVKDEIEASAEQPPILADAGDESIAQALAEDAPAAPLLSAGSSEAVAGAFGALVASRFAQNQDAIKAMTQEALRPLIASWLDAHLPALVERLVKAEIDRIAQQG